MILLNDKVAIITEANSGAEAVASKLFTCEDVKVVICARRAEPLEAVAAEIRAAGEMFCQFPPTSRIRQV